MVSPEIDVNTGVRYMRNVKREIEKFLAIVILMLLPMFIIPHHIFAGDDDKKPVGESESKANFVLTIKENLISLKANDVSLKEILEEIGHRMKIEVDAHIPEEEKITIEFDKLSLEDAIKRLSTNYVYFMDSKKEEGRITKIVLLPKGEGTVLSIPAIKEPEVIEGQKVVRPESSTIREKSQQPKTEETGKEESPHPEPFKFEFNP